MLFNPHEYQKEAIEFIKNNKRCALFLDMGLGKTVSTLTALSEIDKKNKPNFEPLLMTLRGRQNKKPTIHRMKLEKYLKLRDIKIQIKLGANRLLPPKVKSTFTSDEVFPALVIAPKRVALSTWTDEVDKWDHLQDLNIISVAGLTPNQRLKALKSKADIYVINVDLISWLIDNFKNDWKFKTVVIDELSCFKSPSSKRFKKLKSVIQSSNRVIGLTGTPLPNGYEDLYSQIYLLDGGQRLGRTLTVYREKYFVPDKINHSTGVIYSRKLRSDDCKTKIDDKLKDICLSMKASDYLNMPDLTVNNININFDKLTQKRYKELEKEFILQIDTDFITAKSAVSVNTKLAQLANGAVYSESGDVVEIHNAKIEALKEIIEVAQGNILVFYEFKHDYDRIIKTFKSLKPRKLETSQDLRDWNAGKIKLALCHPKSAGHGLNLQAGGNIIVWFSLPYSLELYQQANARLYRQGQKNGVIIHQLIAKDTVDEDKLQVLEKKDNRQEAFLECFKARIKRVLN